MALTTDTHYTPKMASDTRHNTDDLDMLLQLTPSHTGLQTHQTTQPFGLVIQHFLQVVYFTFTCTVVKKFINNRLQFFWHIQMQKMANNGI